MMINEKIGGARRAFLFEELCSDILKANGAEIWRNTTEGNRYDSEIDLLLFDSYGKKTIVEIKAYQTRFPSESMLEKVISQMKYTQSKTNYEHLMLIIGLPVNYNYKKRIEHEHGITIVDSNNLLYLLRSDLILLDRYNEFISDIPDVLKTSIFPEPINLEYLFINKSSFTSFENEALQNRSKNLIEELKSINPGKIEFALYEQKCEEILRYLFIENLVGWHKQLITDDELNRYDLICRVKNGNEFWNVIINEFKSRYVVFEFKNYNSKVKQTQVYTTEKYLFQKALRNVCFMISRFGLDDNACTATKGILRESGKLIIDLCDDDLINMLNIKENGEEPSDYLFGLLDKRLLMLSK